MATTVPLIAISHDKASWTSHTCTFLNTQWSSILEDSSILVSYRNTWIPGPFLVSTMKTMCPLVAIPVPSLDFFSPLLLPTASPHTPSWFKLCLLHLPTLATGGTGTQMTVLSEQSDQSQSQLPRREGQSWTSAVYSRCLISGDSRDILDKPLNAVFLPHLVLWYFPDSGHHRGGHTVHFSSSSAALPNWLRPLTHQVCPRNGYSPSIIPSHSAKLQRPKESMADSDPVVGPAPTGPGPRFTVPCRLSQCGTSNSQRGLRCLMG